MLFSKKSKDFATPPSVASPFAANGEPDMRGLGRILWQKKARIFGFTLLATGAAILVVNAITPRYQSESRLLLEARESVFLRAEADKTGERTTIDPEAVTSQIQLVLSRDLAREVIKKEMLAENPEFDPASDGLSGLRGILGALGIGRDLSTMSRDERTLEAYYDRLNVYAVEKSRVIAIDFSSTKPELAALIANTIAETYLNMQQATKQDQTRAAGNWLAGEIDKMRTKVADAEAKVEEYRSRANLFAGSNNTSLPSQQLTEINSQIAAARGQKADLEARVRQLRDLINSGRPIDSADIASSDAMRRLIEQRIAVRAQLAEQSTTLLDQHPRIKELRAQAAEIDRQIQLEDERLLRQLDNDANVASDRLAALTVSLDQVKKLASQTNEQDVQLRALEREAKTQRDLLESYLAKYREASARDSINAAPPEARIISRATSAMKPAYPKKLAIVLIAAFAAFALSAGFTVTGALLAPTTGQYIYAYAPVYAPPATMMTGPPPPPTPKIVAPPLAPAVDQAARNRLRLWWLARWIALPATCGGRATVVVASAWSVLCVVSVRLMPLSCWLGRSRIMRMWCWWTWRLAHLICQCYPTTRTRRALPSLRRGQRHSVISSLATCIRASTLLRPAILGATSPRFLPRRCCQRSSRHLHRATIMW